jgi:hypothetical protein
MENFEIKIISCEVDRKISTLENVITHVIWQYILDLNGIKESLVFRTILNPPKKKGFIKITEVDSLIIKGWVLDAIDLEATQKELRDFHSLQNNKETYIFTPTT